MCRTLRAPEIRTGHLWVYRGELGDVVYDCGRQRLLKVPPRMSRAPDLNDLRMLCKHVVVGKCRINLEIPTVTGQHLQRPVPITGPRKAAGRD
jgi:hypothetical protein